MDGEDGLRGELFVSDLKNVHCSSSFINLFNLSRYSGNTSMSLWPASEFEGQGQMYGVLAKCSDHELVAFYFNPNSLLSLYLIMCRRVKENQF